MTLLRAAEMAATMGMSKYLAEIRHAVSSLLPLLWDERTALQELSARLAELTRITHEEYYAADWISMNAEDAKDVMLATGRHWDTYFGPDKKRYEVQQEHDELGARVAARRFSIDALAANVIQHGKQGIALVHGKHPPKPPRGRSIGRQQLSEILWQARNQASHWEEQEFSNPAVHGCFKALAVDIDPKFSEYLQRNLALDVVEMLGWRTVADFERDMLTME